MVPLHQAHAARLRADAPLENGLQQAVRGDLDQQRIPGHLAQPLLKQHWGHHVVDVVVGAGRLPQVRVPLGLRHGGADPALGARLGVEDHLVTNQPKNGDHVAFHPRGF